ncbi:acyl-CoA dehydrogenase family protein [Hyalangium versicolor]|uniref:acyl-CoA dehydrogenase family protein n=1 Tax=Hyalangium versicolor TaxID=2861190 RepID=UPI001CCD51EC|nr:acyl-CoA dehydrogenase family protein [Hyalangium versicolor]
MPPAAQSLLATAQQLAPRISARAEEIENARRLPADLAQELAQAGFFRTFIPEAYGGSELHPAHSLEIIETIARADGSTGWCVMIGSATAMVSAWLPEASARNVYSPPETITGGVAAPIGRAERVDGGFRVSGRWPWASGSHNCQWLMGGALIIQDGKPLLSPKGIPEARVFVFPAKDTVLHDTWHASGLCGTGSCDIEVKDLFVPAEYSFSLLSERPRVQRPLYGFPPFALLGVGLPAVALGIARRAIDDFVSLAQQKVMYPSRKLLCSRGPVQQAVAEAEALLRSARALLYESVHQAFDAGAKGDVSLRTRADLRLSYTHATRTSARVVDMVYELAGGPAVFRTSPLQRCLRDVHVATHHAMVAPPTLETIGGVLLGVETETAFL